MHRAIGDWAIEQLGGLHRNYAIGRDAGGEIAACDSIGRHTNAIRVAYANRSRASAAAACVGGSLHGNGMRAELVASVCQSRLHCARIR